MSLNASSSGVGLGLLKSVISPSVLHKKYRPANQCGHCDQHYCTERH
jgi:hypothetical protein